MKPDWHSSIKVCNLDLRRLAKIDAKILQSLFSNVMGRRLSMNRECVRFWNKCVTPQRRRKIPVKRFSEDSQKKFTSEKHFYISELRPSQPGDLLF